jgi:hypothetical protein
VDVDAGAGVWGLLESGLSGKAALLKLWNKLRRIHQAKSLLLKSWDSWWESWKLLLIAMNAWSKLRLSMCVETILSTTATLELSIDLLGMLGLW